MDCLRLLRAPLRQLLRRRAPHVWLPLQLRAAPLVAPKSCSRCAARHCGQAPLSAASSKAARRTLECRWCRSCCPDARNCSPMPVQGGTRVSQRLQLGPRNRTTNPCAVTNQNSTTDHSAFCLQKCLRICGTGFTPAAIRRFSGAVLGRPARLAERPTEPPLWDSRARERGWSALSRD
jgi:hypothetical protein